MIFNSFHFFYFFIIVTSLFFILNHKYRWLLLLVSSCYFYMVYVPMYILILLFTIIIDYFAGIFIDKLEGKNKFRILLISIVCNIGILCVFKYYNFFITNFNFLSTYFGLDVSLPFLNFFLPIGLSFHTFQAMSYTIEVYRGNQKPEKHFGIYSLYVMFYPQLVAGPIERPQNIIHQFYEKKKFDLLRIKSGLILMLWGLFKKVVIADRLSLIVDKVYGNYSEYNGYTLLIASLFFSFQIFCDFSGYSDIAIGAARTMGFDLMKNFQTPYNSSNIKKFWSSWHISLSTWFRDYLYFPLGGSKVKYRRYLFNVLLVFVLSGFWHGANWTFIVWGGLNGALLIVNSIVEKYHLISLPNNKILDRSKIIFTFLLVTIMWVFFRAKNIKCALYILESILVEIYHSILSLFRKGNIVDIQINKFELFFCIGLIFILELSHYTVRKTWHNYFINHRFFSWFIYSIAMVIICFYGVSTGTNFIYFQF